MTKRNSFAKIGAIIMAMVVGLGLLGIGFSSWSDTLNIIGTAEIGTWQVALSEGTSCSENVTCSVSPANRLNITITNASPGGDYSCDNFDIHNIGTVPVRIQSISISSPSQVTTEVVDVYEDDVIEGGETLLGTVEMDVNVAGAQYDIQVTIDTILWNQ